VAAARCRHRGLTLIEIAIAIAVLAILATIAMPSLAERIARQRLVTTAETLALDLAETRLEAAQSGLPLHLVFDRRSDWCYAVARSAGCGCREAQACQLKVVRAEDAPGVSLVEAEDARFEGSALPIQGGTVLLRGAGGRQQLQVGLSPLGRPRVCSPTGLKGYAPC
jgi:type IV fimbrial biogenesis protein FimT